MAGSGGGGAGDQVRPSPLNRKTLLAKKRKTYRHLESTLGMSCANSLLIEPNCDLSSRLPICPTSTMLTGWSTSLNRSVVVSVGCRRWGCSFCGRKRVQVLAKRTEAAQPSRLITLTVDPARWESPRQAYDGTRRCLATFGRSMKRRGEWEYLRVLELTKKGWPHYHLLVRSPYVPHADVKRIWAELTGARIVDVRQIKKADNVYWYLVKYLAKQQHCTFTNRRLSWSRGFFRPGISRPKLDLVGVERESCTVHTWLRYRGKEQWLTPITAYSWVLGREDAITIVTPP